MGIPRHYLCSHPLFQDSTMTTINTSHTLRLTVHIELFDASTSIDLAIPASSSLSETIDEILAIANLPANTTPWCATTAAGQELDPAIPLSQCHLTQGDILVISPQPPGLRPRLGHAPGPRHRPLKGPSGARGGRYSRGGRPRGWKDWSWSMRGLVCPQGSKERICAAIPRTSRSTAFWPCCALMRVPGRTTCS